MDIMDVEIFKNLLKDKKIANNSFTFLLNVNGIYMARVKIVYGQLFKA
jgi:hypothetical protein